MVADCFFSIAVDSKEQEIDSFGEEMKALLRISVFVVILTVSNTNAQTQRIVVNADAKPFVLTSAERNEPSAIESLDGGLYLIADDKVPSLALINEKAF